MKIGIVGPSDSVDKVLEVIKEYYSYLDILAYKEDKVEDVLKIIDDCILKCDGVLFTGSAVLGEAEKHAKIGKPHEAIMRNDSSIMKSFWDIITDKKKINRVSIDIVEEGLVNEVAEEFGVEIQNLYVMPYKFDMPEDEYLNRHIKLWNEGKVDIIISALSAVYNELKTRGLPVYRLNITTPLIKFSMQSLINKVSTNEIKANQIAIQILKIKNIKQSIVSQYDNLIKKNSVEKELINYIREVQGSLFQIDTDKYIIFGTRRTLEDSMVVDSFQSIIENFERKGITIYSGLGFGSTGWNAENNARNALEIAEKQAVGAFYIIDENNKIRGPINRKNETNYEIYVFDERLNEIAKELKISVTYLSKILSVMSKVDEKTFSSDTLSHYLGITERSSRRILNKFINAGYAEVVTTAVNKGVGRPKRIVKISL